MRFRSSLKAIRYFIAAYDESSFTAAALRENATQAGVSSHIRQLETLLGVTLFSREQAGVTPTPAGHLFYKYATAALKRLDEGASHLAHYSSGYQGRIKVGVTPTLTHRILSQALEELGHRHPNVEVRLVERFGAPLADMILAEEIDFALSPYPTDERGLKVHTLLQMPLYLISGPDENLAGRVRSEHSIKMLWGRAQDTLRRPLVIEQLHALGIAVATEMEVDSTTTILDMVSRNGWSVVMPSLMVDPVADAKRLSILPLRNSALDPPLLLIEPVARPLTPAANAFAEMVSTIAHRALADWENRFAAAAEAAYRRHPRRRSSC